MPVDGEGAGQDRGEACRALEITVERVDIRLVCSYLIQRSLKACLAITHRLGVDRPVRDGVIVDLLGPEGVVHNAGIVEGAGGNLRSVQVLNIGVVDFQHTVLNGTSPDLP